MGYLNQITWDSTKQISGWAAEICAYISHLPTQIKERCLNAESLSCSGKDWQELTDTDMKEWFFKVNTLSREIKIRRKKGKDGSKRKTTSLSCLCCCVLFICVPVKFHLFGLAVVTGRIDPPTATAAAVSFQRLETRTEATLRYHSASAAELMVWAQAERRKEDATNNEAAAGPDFGKRWNKVSFIWSGCFCFVPEWQQMNFSLGVFAELRPVSGAPCEDTAAVWKLTQEDEDFSIAAVTADIHGRPRTLTFTFSFCAEWTHADCSVANSVICRVCLI